jgi:hypothetical protein
VKEIDLSGVMKGLSRKQKEYRIEQNIIRGVNMQSTKKIKDIALYTITTFILYAVLVVYVK